MWVQDGPFSYQMLLLSEVELQMETYVFHKMVVVAKIVLIFFFF